MTRASGSDRSSPAPARGSLGAASLLACLLMAAPGSAFGFSDWVALRDAGVVRQELDYSCGVAALATWMTHYWRQPVSERELLALLVERGVQWSLPADWQSRGVSWQILQKLAAEYDLQAAALSLPAELVLSLRVPALVRLVVRGQAHFSLLRGVDDAGRVQLADPSWGNQVLGRDAFLDLWAVEEGRGTLMLLRPGDGRRQPSDNNYFEVQALPVHLRPPPT